MAEHEVARTLVKSPPELWEVCSDASSLARHLRPFGEITITRLESETTVAWEGERVSGTVRIEPSGWGTRVTLTALPADPEAPSVLEVPDGAAKRRRGGIVGWLIRRVSGPDERAATAGCSTPTVEAGVDPAAVLDTALDSLGQAHHRPFSRG